MVKACFIALLVIGVWESVHPAGFFRSTPLFPLEVFHNHASSVVEMPTGDLLACWYRGSGERDAPDVAIMGARKHSDRGAWDAPFVMADTPSLPDCNPVLFVDPRETLWLFWITVQDGTWASSITKLKRSRNHAHEGPPVWDPEEVLHCQPKNLKKSWWPPIGRGGPPGERLGWMPRAHPLMLSPERLMLGLYSDRFMCSLAAFTSDSGRTWEFSEPIVGPGCIQPSFVRREDGSIVALMRDNSFRDRVMMSESSDGGRTWGKARPTVVKNPASAVECIALRSGPWLMVCNDLSTGRWRLAAYTSQDHGKSWHRGPNLECLDRRTGKASYPSLIQARDGTLHCTYSFSTEGQGSTIKHAQFNEAWVFGESSDR